MKHMTRPLLFGIAALLASVATTFAEPLAAAKFAPQDAVFYLELSNIRESAELTEDSELFKFLTSRPVEPIQATSPQVSLDKASPPAPVTAAPQPAATDEFLRVFKNPALREAIGKDFTIFVKRSILPDASQIQSFREKTKLAIQAGKPAPESEDDFFNNLERSVVVVLECAKADVLVSALQEILKSPMAVSRDTSAVLQVDSATLGRPFYVVETGTHLVVAVDKAAAVEAQQTADSSVNLASSTAFKEATQTWSKLDEMRHVAFVNTASLRDGLKSIEELVKPADQEEFTKVLQALSDYESVSGYLRQTTAGYQQNTQVKFSAASELPKFFNDLPKTPTILSEKPDGAILSMWARYFLFEKLVALKGVAVPTEFQADLNATLTRETQIPLQQAFEAFGPEVLLRVHPSAGQNPIPVPEVRAAIQVRDLGTAKRLIETAISELIKANPTDPTVTPEVVALPDKSIEISWKKLADRFQLTPKLLLKKDRLEFVLSSGTVPLGADTEHSGDLSKTVIVVDALSKYLKQVYAIARIGLPTTVPFDTDRLIQSLLADLEKFEKVEAVSHLEDMQLIIDTSIKRKPVSSVRPTEAAAPTAADAAAPKLP